MSVQVDKYNFIALAKSQLELEIKSILTEELVKEQLDELEVKVREVVKSQVEHLTLKHIESLAGLWQIKEELKIHVHWSET